MEYGSVQPQEVLELDSDPGNREDEAIAKRLDLALLLKLRP